MVRTKTFLSIISVSALLVLGISTCSFSDNPGTSSGNASGAAGSVNGPSVVTGAGSPSSTGNGGTSQVSAVRDASGWSASIAGTLSKGVVRGNGGAAGSVGAIPQVPALPLPTVETDSFTPSTSFTTDISDDSTIYANPVAPELSVIVADDKDQTNGGVGVFDMRGKLLQFRQDGMIGNIDLRSGFLFGGREIVLVGANNRTNNTLIFWELDPKARALSEPISTDIPTASPNYGSCLYHSRASGKFYAFVTQLTDPVAMEQYELSESGGRVIGTKVRSFDVGSISEGCVTDDELGWLYVAQEDVALWKFGAEPTDSSSRMQVAAVDDSHIVADLEGLALAKGPGTSGYLVVSSQGNSTFAVYDRESNMFLRNFAIGASGSIDAVTECDGLDITTSNLGPGFEKGALVVHDGTNTDGQSSNLKYVPLE